MHCRFLVLKENLSTRTEVPERATKFISENLRADFPERTEGEGTKEVINSSGETACAPIMPQCVQGGKARKDRLFGIQLPRMKVAVKRTSIEALDSTEYGRAVPLREKTPVSTTRCWERDTNRRFPNGQRENEKFALASGTRKHGGVNRMPNVAVARMPGRVDARVVDVARTKESVVGPIVILQNREIGSAITKHPGAADILEKSFAPEHIAEKLFWSLRKSEPMTITMGGDFVSRF